MSDSNIITISSSYNEDIQPRAWLRIGPYHSGNPRDCPRCRVSTRSLCPSCEHALTGEILDSKGETVCESCWTVQHN